MKQITIKVPDNCELKQDGNTYTIIEKEKEKKFSYEDAAKELFGNRKDIHYIGEYGDIFKTKSKGIYDLNNCTSKRQAEKLLAINKLMNVAKYLNGDWNPNWSSEQKYKYFIECHYLTNEIRISAELVWLNGSIYFKSKELAEKAIEILGEETIRLALSTDY